MDILVELSGGVDSAVAAYLLKKQGHRVIGVIMSIWDKFSNCKCTKNTNACFGPEDEDIRIAQKVADFLKIHLYIEDCSKEYKKIVLENFKIEYKEGRTPNPCIRCNTYIKFLILPTIVKKNGIYFDKIATGHYANIKFNNSFNMYQLCNAIDTKKDQTYFLYRLTQRILSKTFFPLGDYTKKQVRDIANKIGIPVAKKPDSQDFYCGDYNDILQFPMVYGDIIDKNGNILGKHNGIWNYTIGKRKGLGLKGGTRQPLYVTNILAKTNTIIVGEKKDLYSSFFIAEKIFWGSIPIPKNAFEANAKIRQQHKAAKAIIIPHGISKAKIEFYEPQLAVTPGQSVVLYKNNIVLGGGIITANTM
ncbi:MAG: tRNA 2-thiouridine(34) synthase MnmA [Endomicrobium sp.]|jgi:tRNA-specific 2-thiouridylase|nr:tRNA 2-thiouridine(34) synthase MnmA [Endomicrobium sp.]